jgi:N-acetylglucosaminyldiphosphoundecaprenol N-acetyl-beta-D-mannosaminyltransferase
MSVVRQRVRFGRLWVDVLNFDAAIREVRALIARGDGGAIFTPNVDHVVLVESNTDFRKAYRQANLSLADGVPLIWTSRILGQKLPEKLSGSDMLVPIATLAAEEGWSIYLLGGLPGAAELAADRLRALCNVRIVGVDAAMVSATGDAPGDVEVIERIRAARPDVLFVALGTPKQELFIWRVLDQIRPVVAIGVGASLDFLSGYVTRSPRWISDAGFEWAYRLVQDPKRLWRRYLLRGPQFVGIIWRTAWMPRKQRLRSVRHADPVEVHQ